MPAIPGQFLIRTSDAQLLTVLSVLWAMITFMPVGLMLAHKFGHYENSESGKVAKWRRKVAAQMSSHTWLWIALGVVMYSALVAAVIAYWWTASPDRTAHIVSFDLYAATLFIYIGMMFMETFKVAVMYHGTDPAPLIIIVVLHWFMAIAVAVLSGFSLFKFHELPGLLTFAWVIFLIYALCSTVTSVLALWYYFQHGNMAAAGSKEAKRESGSGSTDADGSVSNDDSPIKANGKKDKAIGDAAKGNSRHRKS